MVYWNWGDNVWASQECSNVMEGHYKNHLGPNEEGPDMARLQNELQMPLKIMERSEATLEDLAGQSWRRAEWGCWHSVWSCKQIQIHTPRVFWVLISWGFIWKSANASSALQTMLSHIQFSMEDQRLWGLQSWLLLVKRLTTTQPISHECFTPEIPTTSLLH